MTNFMPRFYHTHTKKKKNFPGHGNWKNSILSSPKHPRPMALLSTVRFDSSGIYVLRGSYYHLCFSFIITVVFISFFFNKTWNHVWKKQFNKSMNFGAKIARIQMAALPPRSHVTSLICKRGRTAHLFGPESDAHKGHPEQSRHKWTDHTCQQIPTTPASHHRQPDLRWKQKHLSWKKNLSKVYKYITKSH